MLLLVRDASLLKEHGIHTTAQRLAVLTAVRHHPHGTAEVIGECVTSSLGAISRQSVYDTLGLLVERGLIRRIQPVGSPALYEDRVNDNHHHMICRRCAAVFDVDCAVGETPCLTAADNLGFVIDEAEVAYWGLCPTCQAAGDDTLIAVPTHHHHPREEHPHETSKEQ